MRPIVIHTDSPTNDEVIGMLKLGSFLATAVLTAALVIFGAPTPFKPRSFVSSADLTLIATVPYSTSIYSDLGLVSTPYITIPVANGVQSLDLTFLIDSGAKMSAIPLSKSQQLGVKLPDTKRIFLKTATNETMFGYLSNVTLKLPGESLTLPVAFAEVTEPVLGMYGFFDRYTVVFDHREKAITIGRLK
jgi:predicted aspartyl protease